MTLLRPLICEFIKGDFVFGALKGVENRNDFRMRNSTATFPATDCPIFVAEITSGEFDFVPKICIHGAILGQYVPFVNTKCDTLSRDISAQFKQYPNMQKTQDNKTDVIQRTRQARDASGMTQEEIAAAMGVTRDRYSKWEIRSTISKEFLPTFCRVTKINEKWLLTGQGQMSDSEDEFIALMSKIDDPVLKAEIKDLALKRILEKK